MAFSQEERQALQELKANGYSYEDAIGFIATQRSGNTSKVERELSRQEATQPTGQDDAFSDLQAGFSGAQTAFEEGLDRQSAASDRSSAIGRISGTLGAGFRAAGEMTGSLLGGAIRAVPGGTTAMNTIESAVGRGVEKAANTRTARKSQDLFNRLPEGVQTAAGDVGNIAMGGLGVAEPLVAPGATRALSTGIRNFAESGVKEFGQAGISSSINSGLAPENLMQRVARISKGKQAKFEERAGQSVGEYLVDRGIFGDPEEITTQLYERMKTSKGRVDSGLSQIDGRFQNDAVADALEQLAEREARVSSERTPSPDQKRVSDLLRKHDADGLTLTEVNEVKRLYERNVKLDYLRDNVSDKIARANNIDTKLREFVEKSADERGFPNVKSLNRETMLAKQLLDDLGAEYAGQQGNNYVSLSDAFFLAEAASNPTALAAFGLKKGMSAKSTMSTVAKMMARKRTPQSLPDGSVQSQLRLPEASRSSAPRDQLLLPEPTSDFQGRPIAMPERSQSTIDAQEQARIQSQLRPESSTPKENPIKRIVDTDTEATETIRAQMLDISEAGISETTDGRYYRTSSFPNWVPKELRRKKLFEKVWEHIDNGTTPQSNAHEQWELYALTKNEIERVKFDKLAQENGWDVGWDDIPFSLALATGAATAAYYMEDETLVPMVGMIGMMALSPAQRVKLVEKQMKKIDAAIDKNMASMDDAAKADKRALNATVKDLEKARAKLATEKDQLNRQLDSNR